MSFRALWWLLPRVALWHLELGDVAPWNHPEAAALFCRRSLAALKRLTRRGPVAPNYRRR